MDIEKIEETLAREEIKLAPLWKRFVAFMVDDLLVSMILIGINWDRIAQNAQDTEAMLSIVSSSWMALYLIKLLYQWFFVHFYGATIGKIVVRIRVIEVELLDNPKMKQAFIRSFFRLLSEILMYLPFLLIFENRIRQALHDKVAKTIVVSL
ncbi:MAG: RDD family protein [Helicobacter sp.]|uniref:RDD family protein n=1 Tax=Helicobacter colisuis TaxID=2949739 RepID=A0ABT0TSE5_9HELI|nr:MULTISPECIES: RDD family protein [Helicobacter]MCI2235925.1 RDD family protein [Helicobacter sp. CaF467b]MCL9818842.1 RDD family protein [Helicobacter colisuis]MCL9820624.1 RDD family protein [Helicobacter colisuis]MCL9822155.1 RDD family protein [Helicobacter colisuis]MDY4427199.1 RDD family protein [Helicobacter sp.]